MENLLACPKCNGNELAFFLECIDYTVSKEKFRIVDCKACGFKFTNPHPDAVGISRYYESEDYISHSNTNAGLFNKIYHFIKEIAIKNKIRLIEDLNPKNKTLLDIGCGTGTFLGAIKKKGWKAVGIEPNDKARKLAINDFSIEVFDESSLKKIKSESFSFITMWHVLEHVHNLKERIKDIYNLIEKDGYAIIAVPNHTSWDAKHYGKFWAAFDVPRHLYHFSPESIKDLFNQSNLIHIKSLPMKFDSYYVSLLSEKYKNSFLKPFKAVMNGWYSNFLAGNNSEKYSSVIYIFQKR